MPTYVYRCQEGHTFEAVQKMEDAPLSRCVHCQAQVWKVPAPFSQKKNAGIYMFDRTGRDLIHD